MCPIAGGDENTYLTHPEWHSTYKYNLLPLRPSKNIEGEITTPYIEFRQHHGTLDPTEMIPWILLTGNLIQLSISLGEPDLLRLVHYHDIGPVNITELFHMIASHQVLTPDLAAMMQYYSRKTMARGTRLRVGSSRLSLGKREAGARRLEWRDVRGSEVRAGVKMGPPPLPPSSHPPLPPPPPPHPPPSPPPPPPHETKISIL